MVTTTVYDVNENAWILTIQGTTPSSLTLMSGGIIIEYPEWTIEEPLILPKFTFKILGTKETIEAFGIIGENSHKFTLTSAPTGWTWSGYLVNTLFSIANTGFDEEIELNGIHELETLKYMYFDITYSTLMPLVDTIKAITNKVKLYTYVNSFSFSPANLGYVGVNNWYDEDKNALNALDVLKHICSFYALVFEHDFETQNIRLTSYSELQRQGSGIIDYSTIKHRSINETYSIAENYLSGENVCSILKPDDVLVNLTTYDTNEPPYVFILRRYYNKAGGKHWDGRIVYENHLHVIEKDEFPNWVFPKYDLNGNPVPEWWDKSKLFYDAQKKPFAGMYRLSYRTFEDNTSYPAVPLTNLFIIKAYNTSYDFYIDVPYAVFTSEWTAGDDNFLLFSGKMGAGQRVGGGIPPLAFPDDNHSYENLETVSDVLIQKYTDMFGGISGINGGMGDVRVPVHNFYQSTVIYEGIMPIRLEISFRDKWWDGDTQDWVSSKKIFTLPAEGNIYLEMPPTIAVKNNPIVGNMPLYEELGQGYAVRFGKRNDGTGASNTGTGSLKVIVYVRPAAYTAPLTVWLQDFNLNMVNQKDSIEVKSSPKSPTYAFGNEKKPKYDTITNYLMSEYEGVTSFSQVYTDENGTNKLSKISYSLPVFRAKGVTNTFTVSEHPEEHQLRIIKELISSQIVLSDVIPMSNVNKLKQVIYNGQLLVRDGFTLDCINDVCDINYKIRRVNYT